MLATTWVLGLTPRSFARATSTLNRRAILPASWCLSHLMAMVMLQDEGGSAFLENTCRGIMRAGKIGECWGFFVHCSSRKSPLCIHKASEQALLLPFVHLLWIISLSVSFCRQSGSIKERAASWEVGDTTFQSFCHVHSTALWGFPRAGALWGFPRAGDLFCRA